MKESKLPSGANRKKKRLGRGEGNGHGKTCCRGHKGAGARSGYSLRPGFEGGQMPLFRKLPQRGFSRARFQKDRSIVNLSDLAKVEGEEITIESLKSAGLIRENSKSVKLLGSGSVDKSFKVQLPHCSQTAREKIESAGGSVKEI